MPSSDLFTTDTTKTLSNIMKNPTDSQPIQNKLINKTSKTMEKQIMKSLGSNSQMSNSQPSTDLHTKIDKEKLIMKILKYQSNKRFGEKIKKDLGLKYTRQQLLKCSYENLESILFRIRNYLNTRNMDAIYEHIARFSSKGYEELITGLGYNIQGFSELLLTNTSFWDNLERYKVERDVIDIPPSMQMIYIVASTTYIAHIQNTMKQIKEQSTENISPKKEKKKESKKENKKEEKPKIDADRVLPMKVGQII